MPGDWIFDGTGEIGKPSTYLAYLDWGGEGGNAGHHGFDIKHFVPSLFTWHCWCEDNVYSVLLI